MVLDINDHEPELVLDDCPTQNEVLEGPDSVSTLICTLSATDQDAEMDTTFTYFLLDSYGGNITMCGSQHIIETIFKVIKPIL